MSDGYVQVATDGSGKKIDNAELTREPTTQGSAGETVHRQRTVLADDESLGSFPTQYAGLRFFKGTVQELCLVALADAPSGAQWRIDKNGTQYAVYLVDTTDPDASHIRIETPAGVKAARLKT